MSKFDPAVMQCRDANIVVAKSNWDIESCCACKFIVLVPTRAKFGKDDTFFDMNLCVTLPIRRNVVGDNII